MTITFAGHVLPTRKDSEILLVGEHRIWTEYWRKGRPGFNDPRRFDWEATLADGDEYDPTGYGTTQEEAVLDLLTMLEERE